MENNSRTSFIFFDVEKNAIGVIFGGGISIGAGFNPISVNGVDKDCATLHFQELKEQLSVGDNIEEANINNNIPQVVLFFDDEKSIDAVETYSQNAARLLRRISQMRCKGCSFYVTSKMFGNYCNADEDSKPCKLVHKRKRDNKRRKKYTRYDKRRGT